ncbi:BTAD domain-containing putative transcriptional regulator [Spirillospora sp. CA-294931]|uniref:BTAD domain-containing putative transcriptional regulator n=1 Tax=Spirillospora sp. CA-294931 TaxID=3240042 RepID=UPI003D8E6732
MATVRVLGAFEASVGGTPADFGGPRQRSVLARLVVAQGRMVPADRLIEDLWPGEAPPRASAGLQSFVSHLRRALEPGRLPRTPAQVLVTEPPGYALRLPVEGVDAWRFDLRVDQAAELLDAGDPAEARRRAEEALGEWRGPAFAEFADLPWAAAEAARLDERRRIAVERRAEAMLRLGAQAEAVPELEAHAAANPLREEAWRLLALALYRAGRQGDALGALREVRSTLAEELGVDPGPALRGLESDILAQAPGLEPERPVLRLVPEPSGRAEPLFVGRDAELARLSAAARAAEDGACTLVLVGGDAGMGKTSLVERLSRTLASDGWTCGWGRAPETGGAPAAWPWAELLRGLARTEPPTGDLRERLAPLLDDAAGGAEGGLADASTGGFRLHLAVAEYLAGTAGRSPLLLVLDDLHWADEETLALLARLPQRLRGRPVLLVGTFRQTEVLEPLAGTLAILARHEPHRLDLGGLGPSEVAALVRATCTAELGEAELAAIAERTGGNPFFTRETARLLESEGPHVAARAVPAGVGDVLRRRVAALPENAQLILRYAAVVGRDAPLGVLTEISGRDEDTVIDAVEAGLAAGLIEEPDAGGIRFAHALVRDTLYEGLSLARRTRLHAGVAAALERRRPDEVAAIAHHYLEAGSAPDKAVHYARLAAEAAEARFAHRAAFELWVRAAETLRAQGEGTVRERLEAEIAAIRSGALAGEVVEARERRQHAIADAQALGDVRLLARVIDAFLVPTLWSSRLYGTLDRSVVDATEEALAGLPDGEDELRARLLAGLALEVEGESGDLGVRGPQAALEAIEIARRVGRPELLAVALNGRFLSAYRTAADRTERIALGTELLELATANDLGIYAVLAHLQLHQVHVTALELDLAKAHVEAGRRLAEQYGMPLLALIGGWFDGLCHALAGRFEDAERAYEAMNEIVDEGAVWSSERGMAFIGVYCSRLAQGRVGELAESIRWMFDQWAHVGAVADLYALALLGAGREDEARRITADARPIRPDYFYDLAMTARGMRAIALGQRDVAEEALEGLEPYKNQFAGGTTGTVVIGPVAQTLGDLAAFLDRPDRAAEYYRLAAEVGARAGGPFWVRHATASLDALGSPAA